MVEEIITISLKSGIVNVNCYLIKLSSGFILIDTGLTKTRNILEQKLNSAGCNPGNLELIIVTHGDFDHIGNCEYIRNRFKTKIAMHIDDTGMAENGDIFWNRKKPNFIMQFIAKSLFKLNVSDRFTPDILIKDEDDLKGYGLEAKIIRMNGHSKGSIGILTKNGDLFCGDLFENIRKPKLNSIMDSINSAKLSVEKIRKFNINTVYPGHGNSFLMNEFLALYHN